MYPDTVGLSMVSTVAPSEFGIVIRMAIVVVFGFKLQNVKKQRFGLGIE